MKFLCTPDQYCLMQLVRAFFQQFFTLIHSTSKQRTPILFFLSFFGDPNITSQTN
uniref:Uncharacterized protein n=1 Tax=Rhizophora mucronata TaxID=61149 RepID=A0A2P2MY28_RHIMU